MMPDVKETIMTAAQMRSTVDDLIEEEVKKELQIIDSMLRDTKLFMDTHIKVSKVQIPKNINTGGILAGKEGAYYRQVNQDAKIMIMVACELTALGYYIFIKGQYLYFSWDNPMKEEVER